MKDLPRSVQLADKDAALADYFDVLLNDATLVDASISTAESANGSATTVLRADNLVLKTDNSGEFEPEPAADSSTPSRQSRHTETTKVAASVPNERLIDNEAPLETGFSSGCAIQSGLDSDEDSADEDSLFQPTEENYYVEGAPEWAQAPFQALEFTIAKLKLVIPLIHLCGILDWQRAELTPMPGHSRRFIGVWPNHGSNTKIVDVAEMLVPQRYHHKIEAWESRLSKVVLIDDSAWGLVCDEVLGVVTLDPREVRWRSDRTQRAWLAGTLIEHMSAIIDGDQFSAALLQGEESEMPTASCA